MLYLYYRESNGSFFHIMNHKNYIDERFNFIEISEDEKNKIVKHNFNNGFIKVIDNQIHYFINELHKRKEIIKMSEDMKQKILPFMNSTYIKTLGLTSDDETDIVNLFIRIENMVNHYDRCDDKQNWRVEFVDTYVKGKNIDTVNYQIQTLPYINW